MFGAPLSARVGLRRGAFPCFEDRRTSENVVAPTGRIMNSCIASLLPAWLPPLMMLNAGTGMHIRSVGLPASCAICLYSGVFFAPAPALHTAIETARIALAPSLDFDQPHSFLLPSSSCTIFSSIAFWSVGLKPMSCGAMISFTFLTADVTPASTRASITSCRASARWVGVVATAAHPSPCSRSSRRRGAPELPGNEPRGQLAGWDARAAR